MSRIHHWLPLVEGGDMHDDHLEEVSLVSQVGVGLYALDDQVPEYQGCKVVLTTHRIMLYSSTLDLFLPLHHVATVTSKSGFGSWSHPKVIVTVRGDRVAHYYKLSFRMGGDKPFIDSLNNALSQRHWMKVARAPASVQKPRVSHTPTATPLPPPPAAVSSQSEEAYTVTHTDNVGISRVLAAQQRRTEDAQHRLRLEVSSPTPVASTNTRSKLDGILDDTRRLVQAIGDARQLYEREGGSREDEQRLISVEAALGLGTTAASSTSDLRDRAAKFQYICDLSIELLRWVTHKDNTVLTRRPLIPVLDLYAAYSAARRGHPVAVADFWDALCVASGEGVLERTKRGATGAVQMPVEVVQKQISREHKTALNVRDSSHTVPVKSYRLNHQLPTTSTFIQPADRALSIRRYPDVGVAVVCLEPLLSSLAPLLSRQLGPCDPRAVSQTTPSVFGSTLGLDSSTAYAILGDLEGLGILCRSVVGADGAAGWMAQSPSYFDDDDVTYAGDIDLEEDVVGGPLNTAFHWNYFGGRNTC